MKEISKYEHIIWDWNGTLLDDVCCTVEVNNLMLGKRNLELMNYNKYKEIFYFPVKQYYKKIGYDFEKETFESIADEFISEFGRRSCKCQLYKGAIKVLKYFEDMGISQSILSATHEELLKKDVKRLGIEKYFIKLNALNNSYAESKVELGKTWIKLQKYNPENVLLIGDTIHDFEVSMAIGSDCLLISNGHQSYDRLKQTGTEVIETIEEILTMNMIK